MYHVRVCLFVLFAVAIALICCVEQSDCVTRLRLAFLNHKRLRTGAYASFHYVFKSEISTGLFLRDPNLRSTKPIKHLQKIQKLGTFGTVFRRTLFLSK